MFIRVTEDTLVGSRTLAEPSHIVYGLVNGDGEIFYIGSTRYL